MGSDVFLNMFKWLSTSSTVYAVVSCLVTYLTRLYDLTAIVNSLYPDAPGAVHDRLQDIFDKMDDLKDSDMHMVTCLLYTVAQKHAEVFKAIVFD